MNLSSLLNSLVDEYEAGTKAATGPDYDPGPRTCDLWLEVWREIVALAEKRKIKSLDGVDDLFCEYELGDFSVHDLLGDLELALLNGGNREPKYHTALVAVCGDLDRLFVLPGDAVDLTVRNIRLSTGCAFTQTGEWTKAEAAFKEWLKADPNWVWGYIGIADAYSSQRETPGMLKKSEEVLRDALKLPGLDDDDREAVQERLDDFESVVN